MSKRVLVLDECDLVRDALAEELARHGYEVECVSSSEDALEIVTQNKFDLLLIDIEIPGRVHPEEIIQLLKVHQPGSKVAAVVTVPDTWDRIMCSLLGVSAYLEKPKDVIPGKLITNVQRILDG